MTNIKKKVKAVIFDMDGTILRTEGVWGKATTNILQQRGHSSFTEQQVTILRSLSGIGLTPAAELLKKEFALTCPIDKIAEDIKIAAFRLFEENLQFIEGFEIFHKKLQDHFIPTSIATNADQSSLHLLNKKMNLERFFGKNLYCIEHVGNKAKPSPDVFLHAAKKLNVSPSECIVFEDSLFGFQAAQAAGMKCIAIKNSINKNSLNLVDDAIDSYHEAEKALLKLTS